MDGLDKGTCIAELDVADNFAVAELEVMRQRRIDADARGLNGPLITPEGCHGIIGREKLCHFQFMVAALACDSREVMTQEQVISDEEPQWAAFIAIDWADREHIWKLQEAESGACEQGKLEQTPEAIETWASQLATRFGGRPIAVALEQSRGAVVFALTKYCHLHWLCCK